MQPKPLLIFDGDCTFCRRWIERWKSFTGETVDYAPYQEAGVRYPQFQKADFEKSVVLVEPDGTVTQAAHAVFKTLSYQPSKRWLLFLYERLPGFKLVTESFYKLVAGNRVFFSSLTKFFWGTELRTPAYFFSSFVFLKALNVCYFFAFVSLGLQILGLVGSQGITPAADYFKELGQRFGPERFWLVPTLAWLHSSDFFLLFLCWGGAALSLLALLGLAPAILSFLMWLFYLSLFYAGQNFLTFQWDILLLEIGFLAIFLSPLHLGQEPTEKFAYPKFIRFLLVFLLFRLMFLSGAVKLLSGDPTWKNLEALFYHYETQPLPTWMAWYAHQLPGWFQKFSCAVMFGIELFIPFLFFLPRRLRHFACAVTVLFMVLIVLTGNYCFFNLLALALCLLLIDDAAWPGRLKAAWKIGSGVVSGQRVRCWPKWIYAPVGVFVLMMGLFFFSRTLRFPIAWPSQIVTLAQVSRAFHMTNSYGLFSVMTTSRLEIVIEGSNDGSSWKEYEFRYKPGDVSRAPRFNLPHQPRLDWQMWFAALGSYHNNPWLVNFCYRLLQGSKPVLSLLKENPFPDRPPRYIRAAAYGYHFTDWKTKRETGRWWRRERQGLYMPTLSLNS